MGEFSWICPKCKRSIVYGELVHLRHIRHGIVLGETIGYNNGYGYYSLSGTDPLFGIDSDELPENESNYPNTSEEIEISLCEFEDSAEFEKKLYNGKFYDWIEFRKLLGYGDLTVTPPDSVYELWDSLSYVSQRDIKSGISAYHEYCFKSLTDDERNANVISEDDPNQGRGDPKFDYC